MRLVLLVFIIYNIIYIYNYNNKKIHYFNNKLRIRILELLVLLVFFTVYILPCAKDVYPAVVSVALCLGSSLYLVKYKGLKV